MNTRGEIFAIIQALSQVIKVLQFMTKIKFRVLDRNNLNNVKKITLKKQVVIFYSMDLVKYKDII